MKQIREVLRLHLTANLSARKIKGATGVVRTTVQEYIKRCKESGLYSHKEVLKMNDDKLNQKLFGTTSTTISPDPTKVMPNYNYVYKEIKCKKKTKVTLMFLGHFLVLYNMIKTFNFFIHI